MIEPILFSVGFCIFFVLTFFILQATRLEEFFKKGKTPYITIAYILISFISKYSQTNAQSCLDKYANCSIVYSSKKLESA